MMGKITAENQRFESLAPNAEMRSLLEHSSRSIIILDELYRILWFNAKAAREMYSFFSEKLKTGNSYWDYVDQNQNKRFIRNFQTALKGRTISTEQKIKKPESSAGEIWIEGRFSPLYDKAGQPHGVIYSYSNISDRKRSEEKEKERDLVLQAIDNNSSQGFMLIDEQNEVVSCNLLAPSMFAIISDEKGLHGHNIIQNIHPKWRAEFEGGMKVARSGGTVSVEFDSPNEDEKVVEVRFTPLKHSLGKQSMVSVWFYDITNKKKAEREVRQSEENLRAVFDSSSQTFYLLDRQLNILAFNQASADIIMEQFGFELQIGSNVADITFKENLLQFKVETERAFSGRKVHVEKHFVINDKEYWFDRHINPVWNSQGEIDRLTIWSIDITDRKLAEKALKENESKFRKLASLLPVGIYQVNEKGNTTYVNESLQLIIGASLTTILDGSWTEQIQSEDLIEVQQKWKHIEKEKKSFSMEYRFKRQNGDAINVLEQAQPLFDHLGEYKGYLGTIIDVSEQKRNQKLIQEKQVAENSLKFRSDFLASMSHEIRTPLNGIMGLSEILLDSNLNSDQSSKIQNILGASKDLQSIVNDVLHLSELEAGKVILQKELFKVSDLIETITERFNPEAKAKGLTLSFNLPSEEIELETDRRRLTQVLSNLVKNAIKFTVRGLVSVHVKIENGTELLLQITDTGIGIPKKDKSKLFQDFSQLQHTTAQNLEGTGLGLSISKKLMKLLGGEIGVESTVNKGSTFWLKLPIKEQAKSNNLKSSALKKEKPIKTVDGVRVLLVEDNLINQQAFKIMLQKMGCKVDVLSNGKQAVENFDKSKYDIVFMDIQMPEMDGLEATTEIKRRFENVPPIIGLSGNILQRDEDGNLKSDMNDLLLKPVVSHDIERMIKKWVA